MSILVDMIFYELGFYGDVARYEAVEALVEGFFAFVAAEDDTFADVIEEFYRE